MTEFYLYVGTSGVGSANIYAGYEGTSRTKTLTNLPTNGSPVYVRLWFRLNGALQYADYRFTAAMR